MSRNMWNEFNSNNESQNDKFILRRFHPDRGYLWVHNYEEPHSSDEHFSLASEEYPASARWNSEHQTAAALMQRNRVLNNYNIKRKAK